MASWAVMATSGLEQSRAAAVSQEAVRRQGRRDFALCGFRQHGVGREGELLVHCWSCILDVFPEACVQLAILLGSCH